MFDALSGHYRDWRRRFRRTDLADLSPSTRRVLTIGRFPARGTDRPRDGRVRRRLAGTNGRVSICTCIETESERRAAERTCAILAEAFAGPFETRVANESIETFLESNAPKYDLVCIGASTDRSRASRFLSAPTFRRVEDLDCDLPIVHRS